MLLTAYFWLMVTYLAASLVAKLAKARQYAAAAAASGPGFWLEEVAGNLILAIGLLGLYGHLHGTPLLGAAFWQGYLVVLLVFSAAQFFMPKMALLLRERGPRAVWLAAALGLLMMLPMILGLWQYARQGFGAGG